MRVTSQGWHSAGVGVRGGLFLGLGSSRCPHLSSIHHSTRRELDAARREWRETQPTSQWRTKTSSHLLCRLSLVAVSCCIISSTAARAAGERLESLGRLPCLDLLSAEITCEGEIISKICVKNGLEDTFVTALKHF